MKIAITGTTSGLGKSLKALLEQNYEIISLNRSELVDRQLINLSGVDILINNAGHSVGGGKGLINQSLEQCNDIIDTNLTLPVLLTKKFLDQNSSGAIVFITSKSVEKFIGGDSVYTAAKTGLSAFIECVRDELRDTGYRLIEIRPGRIKTSFAKNRQIHDNNAENFYDDKRFMTTTEVVNAIMFALQSDCIEKITLSK